MASKWLFTRPDGPYDYPSLGFTAFNGDILDSTSAPDAYWTLNGNQSAAETVKRHGTGSDSGYVEPLDGLILTWNATTNRYEPRSPSLTFAADVAAVQAARDATLAVGSTNDAIIAAQISNPGSATTAALGPVVTAAVRRGPQVSDLTYPLVISHRGAGNIFPEGTLYGYVNAASLKVKALELGDFRALSDGGIADVHDGTVDRTTDGTGNVSDFNTAGIKRLNVDASSWFGGGNPDTKVPFLGEVLSTIAPMTVIFPEVKDVLDSTASEMAKQIKSLGVSGSCILASFALQNLQVPEAAGLNKINYVEVIASAPSPAALLAAGVKFVGINHNATGDIAGFVSTYKAAGLRVFIYVVDHQYDYDVAMAMNPDGVFSNDPFYTSRNYAAYRKTATSWHVNGTWGHGMIVQGDGTYGTNQRGGFVGAPGAWRWKPANNAIPVAGEISPVANPGGSYTITAKFVVEGLPTNTSQGAIFFVAGADDRCTNIAGNVPNTYIFKLRGTGGVQAWACNAAGAATSLGTVATTVWSIPTLSAGLTAGAAVTSLPVNALTVALKTGHQFALPTGQFVTLTADAAVSATSLSVASVTPSSAVPSGSQLLPYITAVATISPTTVTFRRSDEAGSATISANDTTQRGGYIYPMNAIDVNTGGVSFHTITVT